MFSGLCGGHQGASAWPTCYVDRSWVFPGTWRWNTGVPYWRHSLLHGIWFAHPLWGAGICDCSCTVSCVMCHQKMKGVRKYMLTMHNVSMQMPQDWEEVQVTVIRPGPIPTSSPCGNTIPDDDRLIVSLPAAARSVTHTFAHRCVSVLVYGNCALPAFSSGLWCLFSLCVWRETWLTPSAWTSDAIRMPTVSSMEQPTPSFLWTLWDAFQLSKIRGVFLPF